jgi:hypothetical protein
MSISDILHEWRHQRRLTVMGWKKVVPEEDEWCPDCGASLEFCECNTALNFEEEKDALD